MIVSSRQAIALLLGLAATALLPITATAEWLSDGTPVCTARGLQTAPVAASDGAGGAILAWADLRNGNFDVFAQRVSAAGIVLWDPAGVPVCTARGGQSTLDVVADGAGGAFVVWHDYRCGSHVYAQRIDSAGRLRWGADGVLLCSDPGWQVVPQCIDDGIGGLIAAWVDSRGALYAQRIDPDGAIVWGESGVQVAGSGDPAIVADGAGGAFVAFAAYTVIYAQRVSPEGEKLWAPDGILLNTPAGYSGQPALTPDGAGGVIAVWTDGRAGGADLSIAGQRLDADGHLLWDPTGTLICVAQNGQAAPVVVPTDQHGAMVAWLDWRTGHPEVFATAVSPTGDPFGGTSGHRVSIDGGDHSNLRAVRDGAQGAILAWQDHDEADSDVFVQRTTRFGYAAWTSIDLRLTPVNGARTLPALVSDGVGGAIAAWSDARSDAGDIYAARVDSNGTVSATVDVPSFPTSELRLRVSPNPALGHTALSFRLVEPADVWIDILDLEGARVRALTAGKRLEAGAHSYLWDSRDERREPVPPGIYFARVRIGNARAYQKVVVIR